MKETGERAARRFWLCHDIIYLTPHKLCGLLTISPHWQSIFYSPPPFILSFGAVDSPFPLPPLPPPPHVALIGTFCPL